MNVSNSYLVKKRRKEVIVGCGARVPKATKKKKKKVFSPPLKLFGCHNFPHPFLICVENSFFITCMWVYIWAKKRKQNTQHQQQTRKSREILHSVKQEHI